MCVEGQPCLWIEYFSTSQVKPMYISYTFAKQSLRGMDHIIVALAQEAYCQSHTIRKMVCKFSSIPMLLSNISLIVISLAKTCLHYCSIVWDLIRVIIHHSIAIVLQLRVFPLFMYNPMKCTIPQKYRGGDTMRAFQCVDICDGMKKVKASTLTNTKISWHFITS